MVVSISELVYYSLIPYLPSFFQEEVGMIVLLFKTSFVPTLLALLEGIAAFL